MIALHNLEKSFPQADGRLYVLRRITLDIARIRWWRCERNDATTLHVT